MSSINMTQHRARVLEMWWNNGSTHVKVLSSLNTSEWSILDMTISLTGICLSEMSTAVSQKACVRMCLGVLFISETTN